MSFYRNGVPQRHVPEVWSTTGALWSRAGGKGDAGYLRQEVLLRPLASAQLLAALSRMEHKLDAVRIPPHLNSMRRAQSSPVASRAIQ